MLNYALSLLQWCLLYDAPEMEQKPWGTQSRDYLRGIVSKTVTLRKESTDRYDRAVGELFDITGNNINRKLVNAGKAAVYRRYCSDSGYFAAEKQAQSGHLGIWQHSGDHQTPWQWRKIP
ncbi:MAG: thermonuclease family protein [Gammaproteobacteria bacterium]|nr:thermonuclease family protein [Gammaproteobacteria bacterium]